MSASAVVIPGFDSRFIRPVCPDATAARLLNRFLQAGSFLDSRGWRRPRPHISEAELTGWFQRVCRLIQAETGASRSFITSRSSERKARINACLVNVPQAGSSTDRTHNTHIIAEIRPRTGPSRPGQRFTIISRLVESAERLFQEQGTRSYIPGFTLSGSLMRSYVFQRNGEIIGSDRFNIDTNPARFIRTVTALMTMSPTELGHEQAITPEPDGKNSFLVKGREFVLVRRTKQNPDGDTWEGYLNGDPDKNMLTIKETWATLDRPDESVLFQKAAGCRHVARMVAFETVLAEPNLRHPRGHRQRRRLVLDYANCRTLMQIRESPKSVVRALRDAIAGHWDLFERGILHEDIGLTNVLVDELGNGFLADLDGAIDLSRAPKPGNVVRPRNAAFSSVARLGKVSTYESLGPVERLAVDRGEPVHYDTQRMINFFPSYESSVESFLWLIQWMGVSFTEGLYPNHYGRLVRWQEPLRSVECIHRWKRSYISDFQELGESMLDSPYQPFQRQTESFRILMNSEYVKVHVQYVDCCYPANPICPLSPYKTNSFDESRLVYEKIMKIMDAYVDKAEELKLA